MAIIGIEKLSAEIDRELKLYSSEVTDGLKKVAKKYSSELVKRTKATAPVGDRKYGKYRDSIKAKKQSENLNEIKYIWYVDSKNSNYRLTHLLVHGHAKRNGERTSDNHFLRNAVNEIEQAYLKEIEEVLKNG